MQIKNIKLLNFRNYQSLHLSFADKINVLFGPNASGKTNLLEAVEMLSVAKSFRALKESNLVLWGLDFTRLEADIERSGEEMKLELIIDLSHGRLQKTVKLNGVKKNTLALVGKLATVLFYPEDLNMITAAPSDRRRFLDVIMCKTKPRHCNLLADYKKFLKNRNQLLQSIREGKATPQELTFWNDKLAELGGEIIAKRLIIVEYLNSRLTRLYQNISGIKTNEFVLRYLPSFALHNHRASSPTIIAEEMKQELAAKQELDIRRGASQVGPHRDDFSFVLQHRPIATFGSRGEFRSAILALKAAELDYLEQEIGERPILLLDDIFSELDKNRRYHLGAIVEQQQTIITTTDLSHINEDLNKQAALYKASEGSITPYHHEKTV